MTTRFFFDTEFNEDSRTIELISIGMVCDRDGSKFYAASSEFDEGACNPWVKEHVLPQLPPIPVRLQRKDIAIALLAFIWRQPPPYQFWAYFADYDWVAFCQLFGRMIDLPSSGPKALPQFCMDMRQEMERLGVSRKQLVDNPNEHDALQDAIWLRESWYALQVFARHAGREFYP